MEVRESVLVTAPAERVWSLIADAEERARWWPWLDLDATPGGRMEERWEGTRTTGDVLEADPPSLLRLTWRDDGWPATTEVELRLEPEGDGTRVTVRHTGWDALPDARTLVAAHGAGWRAHLDDLASLS
ncbi:MAG TPA: SRPBCC domain-containing protein [Acidimicrobiales bacterium]|nr:SRPBCC domain-containing protein [Acidimicrobiales bacterium]